MYSGERFKVNIFKIELLIQYLMKRNINCSIIIYCKCVLVILNSFLTNCLFEAYIYINKKINYPLQYLTLY